MKRIKPYSEDECNIAKEAAQGIAIRHGAVPGRYGYRPLSQRLSATPYDIRDGLNFIPYYPPYCRNRIKELLELNDENFISAVKRYVDKYN